MIAIRDFLVSWKMFIVVRSMEYAAWVCSVSV